MAFEQDRRISDVVKREQSRLRNFIRRRVPDPGDAEDILQDVFYRLVEANRLLMPIEHITGWLFRVARNRITDLFRKRSRRRSAILGLSMRKASLRISKTFCLRRMLDRRRYTRAACSWTNWNWRSTNCPTSNARCSWRTSWKGAASRRCPRRRE